MKILPLGLVLAAAAFTMPALADGDAEAGKKVFLKCQACHMVGENATTRVGPPLNGIVGAEIASGDYPYSKVFLEKKEEGFVWTEDALAAYLAEPLKQMPGTKMAFPGLREQEEIDNVIAYLATFE